MKNSSILVLTTILAIVYFIASASHEPIVQYRFHSNFRGKGIDPKSNTELPIGYNNYFTASGECGYCHGPDVSGNTNVDAEGTDVNPTSRWRSSMMANSARDPYFRAKVEHESLLFPEHSMALETECITCHAPAGHFNAIYQGAEHFTLVDMENDQIAYDGVNCSGCHQLKDESLGFLFSGDIKYDTSNFIYGPIQSPISSVMTAATGYEAVYGQHINKSQLCASCHTLITESLDLDGNPTGDNFVEQATYHEWLNSVYSSETNGASCQSCHMPQITDGVKIATPYEGYPERSPIGLHNLVGGNAFILSMLRDNGDELAVTATTAQFDSTIALTLKKLQHQTLDLELEFLGMSQDSARFELKLLNKAGHKFPSGFPSRRAYIEMIVLTQDGDTLINSGKMNDDYSLADIDSPYEPHYQMINTSDQVQVYEQIMGDMNGNKTSVLSNAVENLKDNRLVPVGFSTTHSAYDTVAIRGAAVSDPDFNHEAGSEGSGSDRIQYHVSLNGYTGLLYARARVRYQSVTPEFVANIFEDEGERIDAFEAMFLNADNTPITIAEAVIDQFGLGINDVGNRIILTASPNPTTNGNISILGWTGSTPEVAVYSLDGKKVSSKFRMENSLIKLQLPEVAGMYIIHVFSDLKNVAQIKVLRL